MILAHAAAGDATKQAHGVGVPRVAQHRVRLALLDQAARIEDADPIAHLADDAEVVADEEDRRVQLRLQGGYEVENLGLDRSIEACGWLVEDQESRIGRERHRDHNPLLHAAGELVGVAVHHGARISDLDELERMAGAIRRLVAADAAEAEHLRELLAHANRRIQGRSGILVHHRDRLGAQPAELGARQRERVTAVDADPAGAHPAVPGQVPDDRERCGRFSTARLPDEAVRLSASNGQADPTQYLTVASANPVNDIQLVELEGVGSWRVDGGGAHRSTTCCNPSATRLTPITSVAIARPGNRTVHQ